MAIEILKAKGDNEDLGIHWTESFLKRHPTLRAQFVNPLDKERVLAQDPEILSSFYGLFQDTVAKYNISTNNIYNMDEKGCMMGVVGKVRVIVPKREKNQVLAQCGNREWVSLIECISIDGRCLPLWVIFKGKQHQKSWYQALESGGHIALLDNGWTNNELGLEWMKQCFEPATSTNDFRLLLLDGHASHISTTTLQFCLEHKIVLLCLPSHSTHLLQPLDVGIFAPLATAYKKGIQERSRFSVIYSIDKVDFVEVYQAARKTAIIPENVQKAWQATGIHPFNPQVVLSQLLPSRPQTPSTSTHVLFKTAEGSIEVPMTPQNQEILISLMKYCMQARNN